MSDTAYIIMALIAGSLLATQGPINGKLAGIFGAPTVAALISFCVGTVALFLLNIVLISSQKVPAPRPALALGLPWWIWTGGLLGAGVVSLAAAAVPRLGAATYISAIIWAQLVCAAFLDHIGAFGYPARPMSLIKLLGMASLGLGVFLIRKG
ncbi:MAG: DMT family transporter [Sphingomonadales bacterium]